MCHVHGREIPVEALLAAVHKQSAPDEWLSVERLRLCPHGVRLRVEVQHPHPIVGHLSDGGDGGDDQ